MQQCPGKFWLLVVVLCFWQINVKAQNNATRKAARQLLSDSFVSTGHIGISITDASSGKTVYEHNASHNFIPASNVKLFSLYAALKYIGDSVPGLQYYRKEGFTFFVPTADPSFLHPDFKSQPVFDFLKNEKQLVALDDHSWQTTNWGNGWSWDDFAQPYAPERSLLPMYGNLASINRKFSPEVLLNKEQFFREISIHPGYLKNKNRFREINARALSDIDSNALHRLISEKHALYYNFSRDIGSNTFQPAPSLKETGTQQIPFSTNDLAEIFHMLQDTLHKPIILHNRDSLIYSNGKHGDISFSTLYSRPLDSLLIPMMHNSDNFMAEQCLLMASNERIGYINESRLIDTILATDLKDIPDYPRWVDGCGMSRYNLFTPRTFVYILHKLIALQGIEKMKAILPTANEGTLQGYFLRDEGVIFAKTGTLSNNTALCGMIRTKKMKWLLFSVMVNNFQGPATPVKRAIEQFIQAVRYAN